MYSAYHDDDDDEDDQGPLGNAFHAKQVRKADILAPQKRAAFSIYFFFLVESNLIFHSLRSSISAVLESNNLGAEAEEIFVDARDGYIGGRGRPAEEGGRKSVKNMR